MEFRALMWDAASNSCDRSLMRSASTARLLQLHDRLANLAAPATDALALSLDERRLPTRIRRAKS